MRIRMSSRQGVLLHLFLVVLLSVSYRGAVDAFLETCKGNPCRYHFEPLANARQDFESQSEKDEESWNIYNGILFGTALTIGSAAAGALEDNPSIATSTSPTLSPPPATSIEQATFKTTLQNNNFSPDLPYLEDKIRNAEAQFRDSQLTVKNAAERRMKLQQELEDASLQIQEAESALREAGERATSEREAIRIAAQTAIQQVREEVATELAKAEQTAKVKADRMIQEADFLAAAEREAREKAFEVAEIKATMATNNKELAHKTVMEYRAAEEKMAQEMERQRIQEAQQQINQEQMVIEQAAREVEAKKIVEVEEIAKALDNRLIQVLNELTEAQRFLAQVSERQASAQEKAIQQQTSQKYQVGELSSLEDTFQTNSVAVENKLAKESSVQITNLIKRQSISMDSTADARERFLSNVMNNVPNVPNVDFVNPFTSLDTDLAFNVVDQGVNFMETGVSKLREAQLSLVKAAMEVKTKFINTVIDRKWELPMNFQYDEIEKALAEQVGEENVKPTIYATTGIGSIVAAGTAVALNKKEANDETGVDSNKSYKQSNDSFFFTASNNRPRSDLTPKEKSFFTGSGVGLGSSLPYERPSVVSPKGSNSSFRGSKPSAKSSPKKATNPFSTYDPQNNSKPELNQRTNFKSFAQSKKGTLPKGSPSSFRDQTFASKGSTFKSQTLKQPSKKSFSSFKSATKKGISSPKGVGSFTPERKANDATKRPFPTIKDTSKKGTSPSLNGFKSNENAGTSSNTFNQSTTSPKSFTSSNTAKASGTSSPKGFGQWNPGSSGSPSFNGFRTATANVSYNTNSPTPTSPKSFSPFGSAKGNEASSPKGMGQWTPGSSVPSSTTSTTPTKTAAPTTTRINPAYTTPEVSPQPSSQGSSLQSIDQTVPSVGSQRGDWWLEEQLDYYTSLGTTQTRSFAGRSMSDSSKPSASYSPFGNQQEKKSSARTSYNPPGTLQRQMFSGSSEMNTGWVTDASAQEQQWRESSPAEGDWWAEEKLDYSTYSGRRVARSFSGRSMSTKTSPSASYSPFRDDDKGTSVGGASYSPFGNQKTTPTTTLYSPPNTSQESPTNTVSFPANDV